MNNKLLQDKKIERWLSFVAWLIILAGCIGRLVIYLQNRDLFIDEANVARNLYERSFAGLAMPLSYEQYAPPIFLWIEKVATLCNGFGELTLRAYPFVAGVASLIVFTQILKAITSYRSLWYPLFILATGFIYLQFSTELKQYMPDVLITLSLILLTLNFDITKTPRTKFVVTWLIAGSISIWSCMPSVFILCGVGLYYLHQCWQQKKLIPAVLLTGTVWLIQFLFYYIIILKPQANSDYLQNFHHDFFLYAFPHHREELKHNFLLCKSIFETASGYNMWSKIFNCLFMTIGVIWMLRKRMDLALLFLVPLIAVLAAASFNQYSLIPRVVLFTMPMLLILAGYGLELMVRTRYVVVCIVAVFFAVHACYTQNSLATTIKNPIQWEEITKGFAFLQKHQVKSNELFVHTGAGPGYIYYTTINPAKEQWRSLAGAYIMPYDAHTDSVVAHTTGRVALLLANGNDNEIRVEREKISDSMNLTDSFATAGCRVFIYNRR